MIYLDVNKKDWIKKNHFKICKFKCSGCGKTFPIDIPIMTKDSIGLVSKSHECGAEMISAVLRPRTASAIEFWNNILG